MNILHMYIRRELFNRFICRLTTFGPIGGLCVGGEMQPTGRAVKRRWCFQPLRFIQKTQIICRVPRAFPVRMFVKMT